MFKKPIFVSLSPNIEKDDIFLSLKLIFRPWLFKENKNNLLLKEIEDYFKEYFKIKYVFLFNSGRSALMAILKSLNLDNNSEILIPGFTCNALSNPIIWAKLKPIYVDIQKETLNYNLEELEKKITPNTKAIVVQHTFGLPENLDKILEITKKYNLILIEDCAHSLGATYQGKKVGTFGKASFFSFGRDKIISSIFGGMAITDDEEIAKKIKNFQDELDFPSNFWIFQQLLHPILTRYLIMPLYNFFELGRYLLILFQKIGILSKSVYKVEKQGKIPKYFPKKMPLALAILLKNQIKKIEKFNSHREEIANFYYSNLKGLDSILLPKMAPGRVYLKFPIIFQEKTDKILNLARKEKIFLDDGWRGKPIVPPDTILEKVGYQEGSCKIAKEVSQKIINLPTHINITKKEAQRIVNFIKKYAI